MARTLACIQVGEFRIIEMDKSSGQAIVMNPTEDDIQRLEIFCMALTENVGRVT